MAIYKFSYESIHYYTLNAYKCHNGMSLPFYNQFWSFSWPLYNYLSQNLIADCHFVVLKLSKSEMDQRLQHKSKTFLFPLFLNLEEKSWKLMTQKWAFSYHFWSFFANYMEIFHKNEVQMVILRCLVCLNLNLVKKFIFSCLKRHPFRGKIPR